jgi:hypothetical protein
MRFGVSERRACRIAGQHRSTQRLVRTPTSDDEQALRAFLRRFAKDRPRWGWRRAAKQARREGPTVNDKRIVKAGRKVGHLRRSKSGPPFWCRRVRCDPELRHDHRKGRITLLLEQQRDSGRS